MMEEHLQTKISVSLFGVQNKSASGFTVKLHQDENLFLQFIDLLQLNVSFNPTGLPFTTSPEEIEFNNLSHADALETDSDINVVLGMGLDDWTFMLD